MLIWESIVSVASDSDCLLEVEILYHYDFFFGVSASSDEFLRMFEAGPFYLN